MIKRRIESGGETHVEIGVETQVYESVNAESGTVGRSFEAEIHAVGASRRVENVCADILLRIKLIRDDDMTMRGLLRLILILTDDPVTSEVGMASSVLS